MMEAYDCKFAKKWLTRKGYKTREGKAWVGDEGFVLFASKAKWERDCEIPVMFYFDSVNFVPYHPEKAARVLGAPLYKGTVYDGQVQEARQLMEWYEQYPLSAIEMMGPLHYELYTKLRNALNKLDEAQTPEHFFEAGFLLGQIETALFSGFDYDKAQFQKNRRPQRQATKDQRDAILRDAVAAAKRDKRRAFSFTTKAVDWLHDRQGPGAGKMVVDRDAETFEWGDGSRAVKLSTIEQRIGELKKSSR